MITYPPIPLLDGTFLDLDANASEIVEIATSDSTFRSSLDTEPTPFSASCTGQSVCAEGVWGGTFHYTISPGNYFGYDYPPTAYGDVMTLSGDGSGSGSASGTLGSGSATWSIDAAGALVIQYDDGWTQRMEILDELNGEYGIFSDYTNGAGRFATYTVYSRADAKPVLTPAGLTSLADSYYNGEVNSWIPGSFDENGARTADRRFGWQFNADGSGARLLGLGSFCAPGETALLLDSVNWQILGDGSIEMTYLNRIRNWYPAATGTIDGDRVIYVLEIDRFDWGGLVFPARLNIEREIPVQGDYCTIIDRR